MLEDRPFHKEWKYRSVFLVQIILSAICVIIILYSIQLIHFIIDRNHEGRLDGIVLFLFVIFTLSYMVIWGLTELVHNLRGMVYLVTKRDYVSTLDSIRDALDHNDIGYEQDEKRSRFFILMVPRYILSIEDVKIDIVVDLDIIGKGTIIDMGPVKEENKENIKQIIDTLNL